MINHAGAVALRRLADRSGLTGGLSRALARRGFVPVHDRGRVLADTAVLIANGSRVLSDLATLRDQAEVYGPIASVRPCGAPCTTSANRSVARSPAREDPGACVVADRPAPRPDPALARRRP